MQTLAKTITFADYLRTNFQIQGLKITGTECENGAEDLELEAEKIDNTELLNLAKKYVVEQGFEINERLTQDCVVHFGRKGVNLGYIHWTPGFAYSLSWLVSLRVV